MLRVAVKNADPMRPARSFGNKDEWRVALKALQEAEVLTYSEEDDDVCIFKQLNVSRYAVLRSAICAVQLLNHECMYIQL